MVSSTPGSPQIPSLKRARSDTAASGSMSPKRANSEVVEEDIAGNHNDLGIDEYMRLQEGDNEADIGLASMTALDDTDDNTARSRAALTGSEKLQMISNLEKMPLELGAVWFLVSRKWMGRWEIAITGAVVSKEDVSTTETTLGPVDNSDLVHPSTHEMLPDLDFNVDFIAVPEPAWQQFIEWYGQAQYPLPREVIAYPTANSSQETRIEVYPPIFRVFPLLAPDSTNSIPSSRVDISSLQHLSVLAARAATSLKLSSDTPYRVWNVPSNIPARDGIKSSDIERGTLVPIPSDSKTPISEFVKISDILAVEAQTSSREWLLDASSVTLANDADADADSETPLFGGQLDYISTLEKKQKKSVATTSTTQSARLQPPARPKNTFSSLGFRGKSPVPPVQKGTIGLQNLGNTCFMNSALQCLAHIPELEQYFLTGLYRHELNPDNPLGMQGQIANAFGALLHHLYPGQGAGADGGGSGNLVKASGYSAWGFGGGSGNSSSSYAPREFKQTLGRFAPAFSGYQQHDTQEFLGFLLDGLHEDLNRVLKKPYVEKPEWPEEGGGLEVEARLARETWGGYMKRNDSIIVDLFQGMYKSTLVCPECSKVSITFDPFMYLTLPLPITKTWRHLVHYIPWEISKPQLAVQIEVPKDSSYGYLKKLFGRWFDTDPERLLAAEVWSHKFYKFYEDYMNLTELAEKDILVVYELPIPLKSAAKPTSFGKFSKRPATPPHISEQPPFIIPVFHSEAVSAMAPRPSSNAFGVPFFVVLSAAEACSRDQIYRAVVERCERWTLARQNLWKYRGATKIEDELEEVVAEIRPVDPAQDEVTEIRPVEESEAGEGWKLEAVPASAESGADVEMTNAPSTPKSEVAETIDADESMSCAPTMSSDAAPTMSSGDLNGAGEAALSDDPRAPVTDEGDPYEIIGPQEDIFDLKLYNSGLSAMMETGFNMPSSGRFVDWSTREPLVSDIESEDGGSGILVSTPQVPLLKATDAFVCQWPAPTKEHFFSVEDSMFERWEPYIHPEVEALRAAQTKSRSGKQAIDIEDCLNEFTKEEKLGEDDLWYCPRCKKHQQATKKFELWSVPDILVVHLKRFSNARAMRDKIDALVDFPIVGLDLGQRVGVRGAEGQSAREDEFVYDLFAVDEHMGGLGGGHYRAYAKNPSDEDWYHFDDSYVTKSTAEESINSNAYLLFYRRRLAPTTSAIDKVRARIEASEAAHSAPTSSKTTIDKTVESVVRPSTPDELPSFEASGFDALVSPSAYDPTVYRSRGGSDDDPLTSPSPGSSVNAAFDSGEEKDFGDSSGFSMVSAPLTEVQVMVEQEIKTDTPDIV
ncbi:cysteine proteinase [Ceratobasidium sp. AG-I]|nr:cysteine proteinase [Ceratobasidium sp. AG-I]